MPSARGTHPFGYLATRDHLNTLPSTVPSISPSTSPSTSPNRQPNRLPCTLSSGQCQWSSCGVRVAASERVAASGSRARSGSFCKPLRALQHTHTYTCTRTYVRTYTRTIKERLRIQPVELIFLFRKFELSSTRDLFFSKWGSAGATRYHFAEIRVEPLKIILFF